MKARNLVLGAAMLAAALAGTAWAVIPGTNGVINACYDQQSGQVRIYDAEDNLPKGCGKNEQEIEWNQVGLQGPSGPSGLQGEHGEPGLSGWEIVNLVRDVNPGFGTAFATVNCPTGKVAIGGGAEATQLNGFTAADVALFRSVPRGSGAGWVGG